MIIVEQGYGDFLNIYESLELNIDKGEVLSLVGGGGKTTILFSLGEELKKLNKNVLLTTTTAIFNPKGDYDNFFIGDIGRINNQFGSITIFGEKLEGKKLLGPSLSKMRNIIENRIFDSVIIEADGARMKPIKAPDEHEPVISKLTTKTIGVIGLDCLDKKIESIVHRPEIFINITDENYSDKIEENSIIKLVLNKKGLFKKSQGEKILILNKASTKNRIEKGINIRSSLFKQGFKGRIIVTDIKEKRFY